MALYQMKCRLAVCFSRIGDFCMDWATWFFAFFLKKDLGKVLLPKAVEWTKKNLRIIERAGLNFYIFDKETPLYMRFFLGKESEYAHASMTTMALSKLFPGVSSNVRVWRDSCGICAWGRRTGPLDFRKIDGNLLRCNPTLTNSGKFNYRVETTDQAINLLVESLNKTGFADEVPDCFQNLWFVKLWKKFNAWLHEIDYENAWKWAKEHSETIKIECRHGEIEAMLLYDRFPKNLSRYLGICCERTDVFYVRDLGDPLIKCGGLSTNLEWLDFRKLPKEVVKFIVPDKNCAVLLDVISPARLSEIIKDIE